MSSDALLMNICYPGVTKRRQLSLLLGTEAGDVPEFGFKPRVGDFQVQDEQYCGLKEVFECRKLPRQGRQYISYQLLRNVLAAYALDLDFCVLLDARRPDLVEQWYRIMRCIRSMTLRTKCKVLTWQELVPCLPSALRQFLDAKYGIVPEGYS